VTRKLLMDSRSEGKMYLVGPCRKKWTKRSRCEAGGESALQAGVWRGLVSRKPWKRASALDVAHDGVEQADPPTQHEQQQAEPGCQGALRETAPNVGALLEGPRLLGRGAALSFGEGDGDVAAVAGIGAARLCSPGFVCDDGEAGEQQHHGDGVQRAVEGEARVQAGGQVAGS
jgi:hypothetical protein